ncbi:lactoylglutathione lyase [Maricaulis sp. D1M11]|uniref:lactoylglutathione lyase n=1 Tax=Maricaulis sp. D1M11 TaxID=3076117 RepID=UPI0039B3FDA6
MPITLPRLAHTMIRVSDLQASIDFYALHLGMSIQRREEYPEGRFSLVFLGYGDEDHHPLIELTHNWDPHPIDPGQAWGHIAIWVSDLYEMVERLRRANIMIYREPGPMSVKPRSGRREEIAFLRDPDGYAIELIQAE